MNAPTVLILPGWLGSGPDHWQMRWVQQHGDTVVEQHDWQQPLRGDWQARLDEVVVDTPGGDKSIVLVAHSLGCILIAAWAAVSRHTGRIRGALLVAPGDVERADLPPVLQRWAPIPRQRLPFASVLVGSRNDPYCSADKAQALASAWGSRWVDLGEAGHINADSGLGDWPEGRRWLLDLSGSQI